jgi:hypothetical protein
VQRMPKSREKSARETYNMTKKKCSVVRMAKKAKGLRPNVVHTPPDGILSNHRSTKPHASGLKNVRPDVSHWKLKTEEKFAEN